MKRLTVIALSALLVPTAATGRTRPVRGAAAKPAAFSIRAPFPCGVTFRVNCGYGRRAHRRVRYRHSTNDYYAIDLTRVDGAGGFKEPIVAVAPGVVRKAGWARRGWAPYGKVVYIEHDFRDRDGKRYQSLYAHLRSVQVRPGQRVMAGTVIGTMGGSSRGRYRRFGPHLHFAMYRGAGRHMGGGQAMVPEPLGRHEDLRRGKVMEACGRPDRRLVLLETDEGLDLAVGGLETPHLPEPRSLTPSPTVRLRLPPLED